MGRIVTASRRRPGHAVVSVRSSRRKSRVRIRSSTKGCEVDKCRTTRTRGCWEMEKQTSHGCLGHGEPSSLARQKRAVLGGCSQGQSCACMTPAKVDQSLEAAVKLQTAMHAAEMTRGTSTDDAAYRGASCIAVSGYDGFHRAA